MSRLEYNLVNLSCTMVFLLIVQLIKLLPELVMSVVEPIPGLRCAFDFSM